MPEQLGAINIYLMRFLEKDGRMPMKNLTEKVGLTSPALIRSQAIRALPSASMDR